MARKKPLETFDPKAFLSFVGEDYLTAIGRVITQWSMMEVLIDSCIWQIAGLRNDFGRIFAAQMQVNAKLDTLQALLNQRRSTGATKHGSARDVGHKPAYQHDQRHKVWRERHAG
jgi:hypothetical protein